MNIKDLATWRKTCFHCGEELSIHPSMNDIFTRFSVKDNLFYAENSFLGFAVHIETGKLVISDSVKRAGAAPLDAFTLLNNRKLEIKFKCDFCQPEECYYDYTAYYEANEEHTHMECSSMWETLYKRDKYYIFQYKDTNEASISSWGNTVAKNHAGVRPKDIATIIVPYLDLFTLTPEKLENKIKTYLIFS